MKDCGERNREGNRDLRRKRICGFAQNAGENLKEQIKAITVGKHPEQYWNI